MKDPPTREQIYQHEYWKKNRKRIMLNRQTVDKKKIAKYQKAYRQENLEAYKKYQKTYRKIYYLFTGL